MENINETLDKRIAEKDIPGIRNALTTFVIQDRNFSTGIFDKKLALCLKTIPENDLFELYDGKTFAEESAWNADYLSEQRARFRVNFSKERLEHLKKVGRKLFGNPVTPPPSRPYQGPKTGPHKPQQNNTARNIAIGVVAAAVVIGVIALIVGCKE